MLSEHPLGTCAERFTDFGARHLGGLESRPGIGRNRGGTVTIWAIALLLHPTRDG